MPDNELCKKHGEDIQQLEVKLVKIEGDVSHIRERMDNGISQTVTNIWEKMNQDIIPAVQDSQFWIGKIKWGMFMIVVLVVGGGIAKIFMNFSHYKVVIFQYVITLKT